MASDVTSSISTFRGLGIPDPRSDAGFASSSTSVTQAGPTAGEPQAQSDTAAVLEARGTQAASTTIEVATQESGYPGVASLRYRLSTDASTDWRGFDEPVVSHGMQAVQWDAGSGLFQSALYPHAARLGDGTVVAVVQQTGTGITNSAIYAYVRSESAHTWTRYKIADLGLNTYGSGRAGYPTVVVLPNNRLIVAAWSQLDSGDMQVRVWTSADSGATWTTVKRSALPSALDYTAAAGAAAGFSEFFRLRMAYKDGQLVLFACMRLADTSTTGSRDVIYQYASADLGVTWYSVATTTGAGGEYTGRYADVVASGGRFHIIWANYNSDDATADSDLQYVSLGDAFQPFTNASINSGPAGTIDIVPATGSGTTTRIIGSGYTALCADETGVLYIAHAAADTGASNTYEGVILRSLDNGDTWAYIGQSSNISNSGCWWNGGDANTRPDNTCAVWQRGRLLLLHNASTNTGTHDGTLWCTYLGGYTSVTMPDDTTVPEGNVEHVAMSHTWRPYEEPDAPGTTPWSKTTSGTETDALASGALRLTTNTGQVYYSATPTTTTTQGITLYASLDPGATGSLISDEVGIRLRLADAGTYEFDVSVRFGASSVILYDNTAASTLGTASVDPSSGVDVLVSFHGADCTLWVRQRDLDEDNKWQAKVTSASVSDAGATANSNLIRWGHLASAIATSDWYEVSYVIGQFGGDTLNGFTNPADLRCRIVASEWAYLYGGVSVRLLDGPSYKGDSWDITTAYANPVENLSPFNQPSPRRKWKATGETQQDICVLYGGAVASESRPLTDVLVVGLYGFNARTGQIATDEGGSFSNTWSFDLSDGFNLDFTRVGTTLVPASGGNDDAFLYDDMLQGWYCIDENDNVRKIVSNSGGKWTTSSQREPKIIIDDYDGFDASGVVKCWPPNAALVIPLNGANAREVRVRLSAQDTYEGYLQGGTLVVGGAYLFGEPYSWGYDVVAEIEVEGVETDDGIFRGRQQQPQRRTFSFAWADGVDGLLALGEGADPDYYAASTNGSAEPVGNKGITVRQMQGLHRMVSGSLVPFVLLRRVPKMAAALVVINHPDEHALVQFTGAARIENVLGDENESELARSGQYTLREVT